jgi:hypothetical protein
MTSPAKSWRGYQKHGKTMRWKRFWLNVNTDSGIVNTDSGKAGKSVHLEPE